jgi:hypothetical protein
VTALELGLVVAAAGLVLVMVVATAGGRRRRRASYMDRLRRREQLEHARRVLNLRIERRETK